MSRHKLWSGSPVRECYYCLKCETPNNCKCGTAEFRFGYSDKLRVPLTTRNKVVFRQFLSDCPIFVNRVPEQLRPMFRDLLRKVKYWGKAINGQEWTRVSP